MAKANPSRISYHDHVNMKCQCISVVFAKICWVCVCDTLDKIFCIEFLHFYFINSDVEKYVCAGVQISCSLRILVLV